MIKLQYDGIRLSAIDARMLKQVIEYQFSVLLFLECGVLPSCQFCLGWVSQVILARIGRATTATKVRSYALRLILECKLIRSLLKLADSTCYCIHRTIVAQRIQKSSTD